MKILIVEPFFTGSHKKWAEEYQQKSGHEVKIICLPGRFWKWRMHGAAITLAKRYHKLKFLPDLIDPFYSDRDFLSLASDYKYNKYLGVRLPRGW